MLNAVKSLNNIYFFNELLYLFFTFVLCKIFANDISRGSLLHTVALLQANIFQGVYLCICTCDTFY